MRQTIITQVHTMPVVIKVGMKVEHTYVKDLQVYEIILTVSKINMDRGIIHFIDPEGKEVIRNVFSDLIRPWGYKFPEEDLDD